MWIISRSLMLFGFGCCLLAGTCRQNAWGSPQGYILTGGPGVGKTAMIRELERRGEWVVREAAEDYIGLRQAKEIDPYPVTFDAEVSQLQLRRELAAFTLAQSQRVFIDRTIYDNLAYIRYFKKPDDPNFSALLDGHEELRSRYKKVFVIKPLSEELYNNNGGLRQESRNQALEIQDAIVAVYRELGFELSYIEPGSVDQRVTQLLAQLASGS